MGHVGSVYFRCSSLLSQLCPTVPSIMPLQLSLLCTFLLGCAQFIHSALIPSSVACGLSFCLSLYFLFFCAYAAPHFHCILSFSACVVPRLHRVLSCNGPPKIYREGERLCHSRSEYVGFWCYRFSCRCWQFLSSPSGAYTHTTAGQ